MGLPDNRSVMRLMLSLIDFFFERGLDSRVDLELFDRSIRFRSSCFFVRDFFRMMNFSLSSLVVGSFINVLNSSSERHLAA